MLQRATRLCWMLALSGACAGALGCEADADVVAAPLLLDGSTGSPSDAGGDANRDDSCALDTRFMRARLPELALDLILDCKVHFSSIQAPSRDGDKRDISPEEFSKLVTAPQLESDAGLIGAALCNDETTIGWYAVPFDKPETAVLCPKSCELFRTQIARVLAQDGCDGPVDASMPSFGGGFPGGGPGMPGSGFDDDAGTFH